MVQVEKAEPRYLKDKILKKKKNGALDKFLEILTFCFFRN